MQMIPRSGSFWRNVRVRSGCAEMRGRVHNEVRIMIRFFSMLSLTSYVCTLARRSSGQSQTLLMTHVCRISLMCSNVKLTGLMLGRYSFCSFVSRLSNCSYVLASNNDVSCLLICVHRDGIVHVRRWLSLRESENNFVVRLGVANRARSLSGFIRSDCIRDCNASVLTWQRAYSSSIGEFGDGVVPERN